MRSTANPSASADVAEHLALVLDLAALGDAVALRERDGADRPVDVPRYLAQ